MAIGDFGKATEFGSSGDMLHGKIRWEFGSAVSSHMDGLSVDQIRQLNIDINTALAQTLEAISVLVNDPTLTSYDKIHQPIFDGVRALFQSRGVIPQ